MVLPRPRDLFKRDTTYPVNLGNRRRIQGFQSVEVRHCLPPHPERQALFDDFPCTQKKSGTNGLLCHRERVGPPAYLPPHKQNCMRSPCSLYKHHKAVSVFFNANCASLIKLLLLDCGLLFANVDLCILRCFIIATNAVVIITHNTTSRYQGPKSAITTVPEWSANCPSVTSQLLICS